MTKPNKLKKWKKKYLSLTKQHENQILKLNAVSQNDNQQYWTSKNKLTSKYNQIQQSISRTRLWLQRKLLHVLNNVVEGSSHVSEGIN